MQVIGYNKGIDGTAVIDYDAEPGKQYLGSDDRGVCGVSEDRKGCHIRCYD